MDNHQDAAALVKEAERAHGHDWRKAASLAALLRARFPDQETGYRVGAASARELRQFEEAAAILSEGRARYPDQAWPLAEQAWLARAQGEHGIAQRCAADLRARFPDSQSGYHVGAASARELREFAEAATLLAEAQARFPDQAWPLAEQAWLARAQGGHEDACLWAASLRARFPSNPSGYQVGAACARELRRFDEAAALLAEAQTRFPEQAWPLAEQAWLAQAAGGYQAACQCAASLRARFPGNPSGYQVGAMSARALQQFDEAETILREAVRRFPERAAFLQDMRATARQKAEFNKAAHLINTLQHRTAALREKAGHDVPAPAKIIIVVGMHRAGTSLCTRIVNNLGIALGAPLVAANFANPDGFQEHRSILECHEALLATLDASWDTFWLTRPPAGSALDSAEAVALRARLKQVAAEQLALAGGVWAFKDPRTTRFLPLWQSIFEDLGVQPVWLLAVRDPRAVAASLFARNGIPLAFGELLWLEHYLDALRHLGPQIAGIMHYETWFSAPHNQLRELAAAIGGVPDAMIDAARRAIKPELRHNGDEQTDGKLELARIVHAWLSADRPDLGRLQRRAGSLWADLLALAQAPAPLPNDPLTI